MSYTTESQKAGRRPCTIVELELDRCNLTYGSAPCTAAIGTTGDRKCFNTRATCQDPDNYDISAGGGVTTLLSTALTNLTGWSTVSGSPAAAGGVFSGGVVIRNIGAGNGLTIKLAVQTPPNATAGHYLTIGFCVSAGFTSYYALNVFAASYRLYKATGGAPTLLGTFATAPQAGDTIEIRVIDGGNIEIDIEGSTEITSSDTSNRAYTYFAIGAVNSGSLTVDPVEGALVVTGPGSGTGKHTYRFSTPDEKLPPSLGAIPSLLDAKFTPGKVSTEGGLGQRAAVTLTFQDHAHHDRGIDPYVSDRGYDATNRGTFWPRFIARNRYYQRRILHVYTGYIGDTFDLAGDFQKRTFVIEKIDGPNRAGKVTIQAKDILKLVDGDRAQCPEASSGRLSATLTAGGSSLSLTPSGIGSTYPASGWIKIDTEIIKYTGKSSDTLTGLSRAQYGTTAASHSADAAVQLCYVVVPNVANGKLSAGIDADDTSLTLAPTGIGSETFTDGSAKYPSTGGTVRIGTEVITYTSRSGDVLSGLTRGARNTTAVAHSAGAFVLTVGPYVPDILYDLLCTYGGIPETYLPVDDWYEEADVWLSQHKLDTCIASPVAVNTLIAELTRECLSYLWWDELTQTVKLKAIAPPSDAVQTLTDDANFVRGSVSVVEEPGRRISQVWVYFDPIDYGQASPDYQAFNIQVSLEAESEEQYNERRIQRIRSRWFAGGNRGQAVTLGSRTLNRLKKTPRVIRFQLDAKDSLKIGDVIDVESEAIQDETGATETLRCQITQAHEVEAGHRFEYTAEEYYFGGRYVYFAPNDAPDYSAATDAQKALYSWIVEDSVIDTFSDGTEPYKII